MNYLEKVAEFANLFLVPKPEKPCIPAEDRVKLRIKLIAEEFAELQEAIANNDLVGVADGFADLQYVLSGAILEFGMENQFPNIFDEVHRSNMSKACTDENVEQTVKDYYERGIPVYAVMRNKKYVIFRKEDDKVLKSCEYSPANLAPFLNDTH